MLAEPFGNVAILHLETHSLIGVRDNYVRTFPVIQCQRRFSCLIHTARVLSRFSTLEFCSIVANLR